jgi:hypothetical protein
MGVRRPLRLPVFLLSVVCLLGAAGACAYNTEYIAPQDGRPRVVFDGSDSRVELAGAMLTEDCGIALRQVTDKSSFGATIGLIDLPEQRAGNYGGPPLIVSGGYWVPRYYGPSIYVGSPGFAPRFMRPPIFFSPSMMIARAALPRLGPWQPGMPLRGGGGGRGGSIGRGGSNGDLGKGALLLVILALTVIPAIDIGLAAGRPESDSKSATTTDIVNAYNDLMRSPGSPCSVYEAAAPGGPGPMPMPGGAP